MAAEVGSPAPDFTLQGIDRSVQGVPAARPFSLADFQGGPVVLVFYPGDNAPVCTRQLNSYTDEFEAFASVGAQVLAISPQSVESHEEFSGRQGGFAFPLLADPDKAVGVDYGIVGPLGFYRRSVFVLDAEGIVRYAHRAVAGLTFRSAEDLVEAVRAAS